MQQDTPARVCVDCSAPVVRTGSRGPWPERCPDDREAHRLSALAEKEARRNRPSRAKPPEPPRKCLDCPTLVYKSKTRWYLRCEPCGVIQRDKMRAERRGRLIKERRTAQLKRSCEKCRKPVDRGARKLKHQLCSACLIDRRNTKVRDRRAASRQGFVRAEARWRDRNPDSSRSRTSRRRAQKRSVRFEFFRHEEVFTRDGWRCQICKKMTDPNAPRFSARVPTLDHVIPLSEGGPHTRANTRCACLECNSRRGNRGGNEQLALI